MALLSKTGRRKEVADFSERNKDVSFGHVEFEEAIGYANEDIQSNDEKYDLRKKIRNVCSI